MMINLPSRGSDNLPDDKPKKLEVTNNETKATFHWPPDCLWPFIDHGPTNET
jgi:hypothetical protein